MAAPLVPSECLVGCQTLRVPRVCREEQKKRDQEAELESQLRTLEAQLASLST